MTFKLAILTFFLQAPTFEEKGRQIQLVNRQLTDARTNRIQTIQYHDGRIYTGETGFNQIENASFPFGRGILFAGDKVYRGFWDHKGNYLSGTIEVNGEVVQNYIQNSSPLFDSNLTHPPSTNEIKYIGGGLEQWVFTLDSDPDNVYKVRHPRREVGETFQGLCYTPQNNKSLDKIQEFLAPTELVPYNSTTYSTFLKNGIIHNGMELRKQQKLTPFSWKTLKEDGLYLPFLKFLKNIIEIEKTTDIRWADFAPENIGYDNNNNILIIDPDFIGHISSGEESWNKTRKSILGIMKENQKHYKNESKILIDLFNNFSTSMSSYTFLMHPTFLKLVDDETILTFYDLDLEGIESFYGLINAIVKTIDSQEHRHKQLKIALGGSS